MPSQPTPVSKSLIHSGLREFVRQAGPDIRPDFAISHMHHGARIGTAVVKDLIAACRAADFDIERCGAVTADTVDLIRNALAKADAA
jgi:hypothetical protein